MNNIPTPDQVKTLRTKAKLTQREAGAMLGRSWRTWQNWELGTRTMRPELVDLFKLRLQEARKRRRLRNG